MSQPLEYAAPPPVGSRPRVARRATAIFAAGWVVANLILFVVSRAWIGGFGGMGVEVFGAIALNAVVLIIGIPLSAWIYRTGGPGVLGVFVVLAILLPALAIAGALLIIYG